MDVIFIIAVTLVTIAIYAIPIIIAKKRKCKDFIPIFILTLLAGWTVFFWFGALVWSLIGEPYVEDELARWTE